jgi:iron complex outermembrane receptor protein
MSVRTRVHGSFAGRKASLVALAVAGALAASGAHAQETAGQENLGEIVVTAQKREQRLQEVPIAISVVSGDALDARGGFNIEGMTQLVPSLTLRKTNVSLNQSLFLRGIGTVTFAIAAQPSVAFVLDGVVLTGAGEAFGDMYDVERVEVLRGPQGTLFGRNASAGVVNVVSKRPGREFGGYVDVGFFQDDETRVKAALDTPISDTLRGRTTLFWGNFPGFIDNVSTTPAGGKANGYYRKGARTMWQFEPSDTFGLTWAADYRESDDPCCAEVIGTLPTGAQAAIVTSALAGTDLGAGNEGRKVRTNTEMRSRERSYGTSLQLDVALPADHTFTSITAWRKWDVTEVREGDFLDIGAAFNGVTQTADFGPQKLKTLSQEVRVASPTGGTIDWIGGLFWSKTEAERYFQRDVTLCSPLAGLAALAPCPTANWVVASGNSLFGADFKSLAAFADGTWNVSDRFRVIGGIRWTQDDLSYFHTGRRFSVPPGVTGNPPGINIIPPRQTAPATVPLSGSDKSSEMSGRAGVQFDWTDTFMTYATYARGYKGPAYNVFFNMTVDNSAVIDAETADSYEVGFKATLGGGDTIVNAALFRADYNNFQTNNFFFIGTTQVTSLQNAGDVRTQGAELEFLTKPSEKLTISGGVSYTDASIKCFNTPIATGSQTTVCASAPIAGAPAPTAVAGDPLPFAPKWKGNLTAEWRLPFATFDVIPSITGAYQSDSYADIGRRAALANRKIDAYGTIDATLAFVTKDDKFRLTIVGRNLTDQSYAALLQTGGPAGTVRYIIPRDADRYFGAQVRFGFGGGK